VIELSSKRTQWERSKLKYKKETKDDPINSRKHANLQPGSSDQDKPR